LIGKAFFFATEFKFQTFGLIWRSVEIDIVYVDAENNSARGHHNQIVHFQRNDLSNLRSVKILLKDL